MVGETISHVNVIEKSDREEIHAVSSESKIVSQNRRGNAVGHALPDSGAENARVTGCV